MAAAFATLSILIFAASAQASPVATDDGSYSVLGAVFPDPMAGCQNSGGACSPNARGNVPATQFIGIDEFQDGLKFLNSKPEWQRYMEVWALDGHMGDGAQGEMFPGNNLGRLEFDPKAEYQSAGIPTSDLGRRKSDLMVVRVTDETVPDAGKKRYALSLSIHGIERAGAEGGTRAIEDLVTAATTGRSNQPIVSAAVKKGAPTFQDVLKKTIIYFTYPNPDGWRRGSVSSGPDGGVFFQRYNGNGVDPNRDWPDVGFAFRPYSAVSEPETQAWIAFYNDVKRKTGAQFTAGDDLHGQPEADALSYTLLPHGRHRYDKNNRIAQTAQRINRATYDRIKWSPYVQDNSEPPATCLPGVALGSPCSRIYAQTWGTVYDTINYTTTGALGDWFDSSVGLGADGIDNEMSFSHLDKNITFEPQTEQLHVDGNKALIYAHLTEMLQPSYSTDFDATGRKGYVPNRRVKRAAQKNFPDAPPGTHASPAKEGDATGPGGGTFDFTVPRTDSEYNGGMRVEATANNVQGIGTGSVTLQVQCKGCDEHPGVKDDEGYVTVAEDYNQSLVYLQSGVVATVNDPQPFDREGKPVQWRAVISGPTAVAHVKVNFTSGPASADGDTGGGVPPEQRAYDVANTDFFRDLNGFIPGRGEDLRTIDPKAVIAGRQSLDSFDTIALADDPLPGYTGPYGKRASSGSPTKDATFQSQGSAPGGGSGAPGTFEEREFTIGEDDSDASATITLNWAVGANDFDLYVYRDVGGNRTLVGSSAGGPPENSEEVKLLEPDPGKYVVQVVNYAAPDPTWTATVKFAALQASSGGTGDYSAAEKNIWFAKLRDWVRGGGNLVLTDGSLRALSDVTSISQGAISRETVYAGQSAFATDDGKPTTGDPLASGLTQQGARFNTGMRRQMYEPTPLGFAIQDRDGADASFARQYDVDRNAWEKAGGRTVATSADAGARDAQAVYTRVTIGEMRLGKGRLRIAGALLPQPTEDYDHQFGLEPYAVTSGGYVMARNLLDWQNRGRDAASTEIRDTIGGRFIISRRAVKLRKGVARVRVSCRTPLGCVGTLRLQVRRGKKLVTVGRKHFRFPTKKRNATVVVKLTKRGRKLTAKPRRTRMHASAPMRFTDGRRGVARRAFWLYRPARSRR